MPPQLSQPQLASSLYFSLWSFNLMAPVAVLYSLTMNLGARLVRKPALPRPAPHETRVAIVTGSNTGIGYESARTLVVEYGYTVILACRSRDKALQAAATINDQRPVVDAPGRAIVVHPLDLSSFASIRDFFRVVHEQYPIIHVLINNAGCNTSGVSHDVCTDTTPPRPLDLLFQSNFLGHYLLTRLLIESMAPNHPPLRIVNVSSVMHHFSHTADATDALNDATVWHKVALGDVPSGRTYALSKLAAILLTVELNRRYSNSHMDGDATYARRIRSMAVNPGAVNSDIWRHFPRWVIPIFSRLYLTNRQGCSTSVVAAVSDALPDDAIYLQPYWLPSVVDQATPFPLWEMLGPYQTYRVTAPRLPADGGVAAAAALWHASDKLTAMQ